MKIEVNITRKYLFIIFGIMVVFSLAVFAFIYGFARSNSKSRKCKS